MKEFFLSNWQLIATVCCGIVEIVIFILFKRRPQVIDNTFITHLLEWIRNAEQIFRHGSDKKDYVLQEAKKYLGSNFVKKDVDYLIEYVLSLPEKKKEVH